MDDLMQRAVYICTSCAGVYADAPVSQCDCMPDKNEFTEAIIYTEDQLREYAKKAVEAERAKGVLPFGVGGGLVAIKTLLSRDPCAHATLAIQMIDALLETQPSPLD